jgi:hypothetical protein
MNNIKTQNTVAKEMNAVKVNFLVSPSKCCAIK